MMKKGATSGLAEALRPGDRVLIGQAVAEPPSLVAELVRAAARMDDVTAICGYALAAAWRDVTRGRPRITSYAAHGMLRRLAASGLLDLVPMHYSRIEEQVRDGTLGVDIVLLQVGPPDAEGCYTLGATVDHAVVAAERARAVFVEVNQNMPRTHAVRRLPGSLVTGAVSTDAPLVGSPSRPVTDAERAVAANVARLIPDGATIQLGIGALAEAIAAALRARRDLRIRSGIVGDWVVDLYEASAMAPVEASCVTGMALGTERLYRFLDRNPQVRLAPLTEQIAIDAIAKADPYVSVNSAIEVDLVGQVNSEVAGGRYVGAVGGLVDYARGVRHSRGGLAIIALSAGAGESSAIVPAVSGPVTCSKSDVDIVVTEWGAADLRSASFAERADRIAELAHPDRRAELRAAVPSWVP
jgi:acyl-CoA hydrolase